MPSNDSHSWCHIWEASELEHCMAKLYYNQSPSIGAMKCPLSCHMHSPSCVTDVTISCMHAPIICDSIIRGFTFHLHLSASFIWSGTCSPGGDTCTVHDRWAFFLVNVFAVLFWCSFVDTPGYSCRHLDLDIVILCLFWYLHICTKSQCLSTSISE